MSKNLLAKYYQGNKERLQKPPERYQNLSKQKKKEKERQYHHKRYKNLSEDEIQNLFEYRKKYYRMTRNALL